MYTINICLSDIPKEKINIGKNGKKYITLNFTELKNPDKFGNTHTLYLYDNQNKSKIYLGQGKIKDFGEKNNTVNEVNNELDY